MQSQTKAAAIESQHVDLVFAPDAGVFDLTYTVPEGSILGMIGPSGCGKTTTVRLALGLYAPQRGNIRVFGRPPTQFGAAERERIGYIPQQFVLYPTLTVAENAEFVASLYGMTTRQVKDRLDQLLPFVDLAEARDRPGSKLSGGMQRRLMLASALMHDPTLLFADEPTAGIDPVLRGRFWDYFRRLRDEGRTLFVTTQYVGEAAYCDHVAVMRKGRLLVVDTPEGLRRRVLGGEVIELTLADPARVAEALELLRVYPPVKDAQPVAETHNQLRVTIDDATEWMPEVLNLLEDRDGPQIVVERAQELQLSFDEVFIRIMEQEESAHGQAT
jgi:ABC-2 type transport system ATP-binding protein